MFFRREEALALYDKAIELNPNLALAWSMRGMCDGNLGNTARSISDFEQALRLSPRDPMRWLAQHGLAWAHLMAGRYDEALSWATLGARPRWHPCTKRTEKALNEAQPDTEGALRARGAGVANVRVSLEMIPRAMAILDEVVRRLEKLGHSMSSSDPAQLSIDGELVPFEISEKFLRPTTPPDNAELARRVVFRERYVAYTSLRADLWIYRPSGRLGITLSQGLEKEARCRWKDGPRTRLEDQLEDVVTEAVAHAAARKARQDDIERRRAEVEERQRQAQQEPGREELDRRRFLFLKERANLWEDGEMLARFVRHLRHIAPAHRSDRLDRMLKWGDEYAEDMRKASSAAAIDEELAESELW